MSEQITHPTHYNRGAIEVIDAMKAMSLEEYRGFLRGNALKYIYRMGSKDDAYIEACKAKYYIDWLTESYEVEN